MISIVLGEVEFKDEVDCLGSNLLNLPDHLLAFIVAKLSLKDKIYFGVVCRSFQSIFKEETKQQRQLPLLMVPAAGNSASHSFCDTFCDVKKVFGEVPLDQTTFCRGSSHGWLVTVKEDLNVSLFNPFLSQNNKTVSLFNPFLSQNNKIQLPPVTTFQPAPFELDDAWCYNTLVKAVISADPLTNPQDCVVMAIYGAYQRLAFCKLGDKSWTTLTSQVTLLVDIIVYRNKFYAMKQGGEVFFCDLNGHAEHKMIRVAPEPVGHDVLKGYLVEVESTGNLMLISRTTGALDKPGIAMGFSITTGFNVFKMDPDTGYWIMVHYLEGCLVFVGDNTSFSVRVCAADIHEDSFNKPNTIWFTDDNYEQQEYDRRRGYGPFDVGVFDLEDGSIKSTYPMNMDFVAPPPIWIQPIPCT